MLLVTAKPETDVRAALIVRDETGKLLDPQPTSPIPVDADSVIREVRRLRTAFGRKVSIDSANIIEARRFMAKRQMTLSA
jgi:hypothetical protein